MNRNLIFSITLLCFTANFAYSQSNLKTFSNDDAKFFAELTTFFETADKKEGSEFIDVLKPYFIGDPKNAVAPKFSEEQRKICIATCNAMLKKRVRALPEFKNYFSSIINFMASTQSAKSLQAWQASVDKLIAGRLVSRVTAYLAMSDNLFKGNVFYKSASTEWGADKNSYTFDFDSIPKVIFTNVNIYCFTKGDSMEIKNTFGTYYPTQDKWVGKGGKVDWTRAGLDPNVSFVELNRYTINCKSSMYTADSVVYTNTKFFPKPMIGTMTDKVTADMGEEKASYPQFDSYNKRLKIPNITDNVDYDGGFSVRGARALGRGDKDNPAMLLFKRDNKIFLKMTSRSYIIREDRIMSDRATIAIYWEKDSIYHPGLQIKFIYKEKELNLIRDDNSVAQTPYFDSFHKLELYFEALHWKLDEPKIDMRMIAGSSVSNANFRSVNHFSEPVYSRIQGMDEVHPFIKLRNYSEKVKSREFYLVDLAKNIGYSVDQVAIMLVKLATMGYVEYNSIEKSVILKDKLFDQVNAKNAKIDYDVIEFNSELMGNQDNASLNLLNFDLKINGVNQIFLSDSQGVVIYPSRGQVLVKQNRDFHFAGVVRAGRFDFFGKDFSFQYDLFKINLNNVDSLRMKVKSRVVDETGYFNLVNVKTVIENINGDLLIDKPNNKSGRKPAPEYPIFNSNRDSYAYWNKRNVHQGVYSKDKVFFRIDPYTLDSLDNFSNDALAFQGTFNSGGIIPEVQEVLRLQKDYSLGFTRQAPPGGFPMYGGKANLEASLNMSNQGLIGDGDLKYITSVSKSKSFLFFPDSMNADVNSFVNTKRGGKPEYPDMQGEDVYVHWMPKKDYMNTHKKEKAMNFFEKQALFHGITTLSPDGMTGDGMMAMKGGELSSRLMKMKNNILDADTSDFRIMSEEAGEGEEEVTLASENVNAHIDFNQRFGDFTSNGKASVLRFPANQYMCNMDRFKWFMDKSDVELLENEKTKGLPKQTGEDFNELSDIDLAGIKFISTHPGQDSLNFYTPSATYNVRSKIIRCREVKFIEVADSRVYMNPDSGKVTIYRKARIETLQKARIVANKATRYHTIRNCTVDIFSKKSYMGKGDYEYKDENKTMQKIFLNTITTDTIQQTYAEGEISDSLKFMLSPMLGFKGKAKLIAATKNLTFNGYAQLEQDCKLIPKTWIKFEGEINPEDIYIPIAQGMVDPTNNKIFAGIMLTTDSVHLYSSFCSPRKNYSDSTVATADGFLFFDKASREYRISNKQKIKELSFPGNYVSLNTRDCKLYSEGTLSLGTNLGQIKTVAYGNGTHLFARDSIYFDMVFGIDFFFNEDMMKIIKEKLTTSTTLTGVNISRPTYEKALAEVLGKEEADKQIADLNLLGSFKKFPKELEHTILFNDLKFRWNTRTRSYISEGEIGIGSMGKDEINKYVKGKVEIVRKRSGDVMNMYLELEEGVWFYFNYATGLLQTISSDEAYNTILKTLKPDKRKMEHKKGEMSFQFILASARKKADFMKRFADGGAPQSEQENTEEKSE